MVEAKRDYLHEWGFMDEDPLGDLDLTSAHELSTQAIRDAPYDFRHCIRRGRLLAFAGYQELGAGDFYKALLLTDEFFDDTCEYHEQVHEAEAAYTEDVTGDDHSTKMQISAHLVCLQLAESLSAVGCYRSAYDFCHRASSFRSLSSADLEKVEKAKKAIVSLNVEKFEKTMMPGDVRPSNEQLDRSTIHEGGQVPRVVYPWNMYEPARYSDSNLQALNKQLAQVSQKLEARVTVLPVLTHETTGQHGADKSDPEQGLSRQFGLFAKEYIAPGEEILSENSILTANKYLHGEFCDACSGSLPAVGQASFPCPDCYEAAFCSQACLDAALAEYHPAVCETDANTVAKDAPPKEAADSLYFLLIARALAMSEHQEVHPLDLGEVKFLWGDFGSQEKLEFSFKWNIEQPFHVLEKMNVNIFETVDQYDVWVFNTLYAKFRGVASGRVNARDGLPEVSAVHPMWCLANHSCAPNVRWEWGGNIRFWARIPQELVQWGVDGAGKADGRTAGIQKDEEIFSHYGDIRLDVHERREWMRGALGGKCQCERCLWEEKQNPKAAQA